MSKFYNFYKSRFETATLRINYFVDWGSECFILPKPILAILKPQKIQKTKTFPN